MCSIVLSKSRYLSGLQCPKLLWVKCNDPKRLAETDATTQFYFDQGHRVGELAKRLFLKGIDIPSENFRDNIKQTKSLMKLRKPLFEAGISIGNLYSRIDILDPSPNTDEWNITEVKSSTTVRDIHIDDLSFQKICCEELGLKIGKCCLAHINSKYVRNGVIDPSQLFTIADVTAEVENTIVDVRERIKSMLQIISLEECPEVIIGRQCKDPYECQLTECWNFLPENNIFNLYRGGLKCFDLFNNGILTVMDIPDDYKLNDRQCIQRECEKSGQPYSDKKAITNFLSTLQYPLYFLDFETFNTAIPLFDGVRPYQHVPFQFSLHIVNSNGAKIKHFSFLAEGKDDPRPELISHLIDNIGEEGSIIVYHQSFESSVLENLASTFSENAEKLRNIQSRLVDLLIPFRNFHYYHPRQKGSASLKKVLPALTGKDYEGMVINKGDDASTAFYKITFSDAAEEERKKVRQDLEMYCKLDTEGMIWILEELKKIIRNEC